MNKNSPQTLETISFITPPCVLVLAPHPDDFDAIGVTLKELFDQGATLSVFIASTSSGVEDGFAPGASAKEIAALRNREQENSLRYFGLPAGAAAFHDLDYDEIGQMADTPENSNIVRNTIEAAAPDLVFLPHRNDTNAAHRAMYSMFTRSIAELGAATTALLCRDPKTEHMRTDIYTPFNEETAQWKARMLRFHDSQQQRNLNSRGHGFDERILSVNRSVARDLNLAEPYAEAFELEQFT